MQKEKTLMQVSSFENVLEIEIENTCEKLSF
jgi:hypothetical protein